MNITEKIKKYLNEKQLNYVEISDLGTHKTYKAYTEKDCKDSADLSAFKSAVKMKKDVSMGKIIAKPVWK